MLQGSCAGRNLHPREPLVSPRVNGKEASWDEATDHIADAFLQIIQTHGPESIGFYGSGQLLTEDYYVVNKFVKGWLGTANIDTNSRLCMASSVMGHKRAFGTDTVPGAYEDLECAELIVLVGSNLAWCHPVIYQRIMERKAQHPQLKLIVIDPRRSITAENADLHLAIKPDGDSVLFNALLHYLITHDVADMDYVDSYIDGFDEASATARQAFTDDLDETVALAFHESVHKLNEAGHEIHLVSFSELVELTTALRLTVSFEAQRFYKDYLQRLETDGDPHVLARLHQSDGMSEADVAQRHAERQQAISLFNDRLAPFDALLAPTIKCERPSIASTQTDFNKVNAAMLRNTTYINLVDGCGMSLPVAREDMPPSALMVCGPNNTDATVIAASGIIDEVLG